MHPFDDDLRRTLARRDPPPGFADRVVAEMHRREAMRPSRPRTAWRWGLAAAAVCALGVAPLIYVQHLRAQEGERARTEVLAAFRVAGASLREVQAQVAEVESRRALRQ